MSGSDSVSNSVDKDSASAIAAARLRSAARLNSAYRLTDPLSSEAYYNPDYVLHKPLPSVWGTRWTLSHEELLRQLNEERSRIKELEVLRARQTTTIGELESEIRNLRINGYGDVGLAEENARLRRDVARLEDEVIQLRSGRNFSGYEYSSRLETAEARVRVLEQQILDDTQQWELERTRLLNEIAQLESRWLPSYPTVLPPVYPPRYVVYRD